MQLNGFHHLTAVTADAPRNHAFYTQVLGLRLSAYRGRVAGSFDDSWFSFFDLNLTWKF